MPEPSIYRRGVCSQHYHILRLKHGSRWADFRKLDAMFFPRSKRLAIVVVANNGNVLSGGPGFGKMFLTSQDYVELSAIEYVVSACVRDKVVTQDFYHPFKNKPVISSRGTNWELHGIEDTPVFTARYLDDMFSVEAFGNIMGAQFCC